MDIYWSSIWKQFRKHRLGLIAYYIVIVFCLIGVYAPFLASSKPFFVYYDGHWYFPLFRYLFYTGFYTKRLDIFFNLLIFTLPVMWLTSKILKNSSKALTLILIIQFILFFYIISSPPADPAGDRLLNQQREKTVLKSKNYLPNWQFNLSHLNSYARLNLLIRYQEEKIQHLRLQTEYLLSTKNSSENIKNISLPTRWQIESDNETRQLEQQKKNLEDYRQDKNSPSYQYAVATIAYIHDRKQWLNEQSAKLQFEVMPLIRSFHWEDDAGGSQNLNQYIPWWELTRTNRKDLIAALIFGVRISLVVGVMSVLIALLIGVPVGAFAGFYGGKFDIIVSRLLEIWESMPSFFMLLMIVAITQNKSIFIVIAIIGIFGWTSFSRYIRGEFFKQRNLPYVEACEALGFNDRMIIFSHILPNAIPPILTLLPFAIMGAITSEAGLSFLGLGEEGSCSWGVLMDEGRSAFPGESYLLWPPALALTLLLIAIALVGDSLRDTLDPKMRS